jgi:two-component system NarL family sensor kinase
VSRDAVAIASGPGSGYFDYYWNDPETGKEEKKISYIVKIPGIDYLIGTGFY